jgi:hypothetical protein
MDAGPVRADAGKKKNNNFFSIRADVGPVRTDEEEKRKRKNIKNFFFLRLHRRRSCPHGRTYALTFFLGGWKCEWGLI